MFHTLPFFARAFRQIIGLRTALHTAKGVGLAQGALGWGGLGLHRAYASTWHKDRRGEIKLSRKKTQTRVIIVQNRERAAAVPGVLRIVFYNEHELRDDPDRRADLINQVFNSEEAQTALKHGRNLGIIWGPPHGTKVTDDHGSVDRGSNVYVKTDKKLHLTVTFCDYGPNPCLRKIHIYVC